LCRRSGCLIVGSNFAFLFDDGEEGGAVGGEAEAAIADGVAGGVERQEKVAQTFLSVFIWGRSRQECLLHAGEVGRKGVVKEQV